MELQTITANAQAVGLEPMLPLPQLSEVTPFSTAYWRKQRERFLRAQRMGESLDGLLPFISIGSRVFVRVADLRQFLKA